MNLPPEFKKTYPEVEQYIRDLESDNQTLREEVAFLKKENESYQRRIRILEKQCTPNINFSPNSQISTPVERIDRRKPKF